MVMDRERMGHAVKIVKAMFMGSDWWAIPYVYLVMAVQTQKGYCRPESHQGALSNVQTENLQDFTCFQSFRTKWFGIVSLKEKDNDNYAITKISRYFGNKKVCCFYSLFCNDALGVFLFKIQFRLLFWKGDKERGRTTVCTNIYIFVKSMEVC